MLMKSIQLRFSIPAKMHETLAEKADLIGMDVNDYCKHQIMAALLAEMNKRPRGRPKTEKPPPEPELAVTETEYSRGRDLCLLINPPEGSPPIWVEEGGGEKYYANGYPIWTDESQSFLAEWQDQNGVKPSAGAS